MPVRPPPFFLVFDLRSESQIASRTASAADVAPQRLSILSRSVEIFASLLLPVQGVTGADAESRSFFDADGLTDEERVRCTCESLSPLALLHGR